MNSKLYDRIDCCDRCISRQNNTATRFLLITNTSVTMSRANFLHQACIAGLVKHLSPYTGHISDWLAFALRLLAHGKQITERCSLRDNFCGNAAISNVYKWLHSDVIKIKFTTLIQAGSSTITQIFTPIGARYLSPGKKYIFFFIGDTPLGVSSHAIRFL